MAGLKQELSYLILGQQGGDNRIKILELLHERSYNINQLANELDLNYRTVKHHIEVLSNYDMITSSGEGYGNVYFLTSKIEKNFKWIKEMKKKLQTVSKSPKLYQDLVEQTHEGIIILDENKEVIFVNESAEKIIGYDNGELLGGAIDFLVTFDIYENLDKVLKEGKFLEDETRIITKSGETKNVIITMDSFHFKGGEFQGFSLLFRDVTEEKKQREILDALMEHTKVMMVYLDKDFNIVYVNSAYAERTDYRAEELVGKNHFDLFPNGENEKIFKKVRESGEPVSFTDKSFLHPDDSKDEVSYWDWTLEPVKNDEKEVKGLVLSLEETTDRVKLKKELEEANERYRTIFDNNPNPTMMLAAKLDEEGDILDYTVDEANQAFMKLGLTDLQSIKDKNMKKVFEKSESFYEKMKENCNQVMESKEDTTFTADINNLDRLYQIKISKINDFYLGVIFEGPIDGKD